MKDRKHLGIRTDEELHGKIQYIAAYEGRSLNGQMTVLIQRCIREFERAHGTIEDRDWRGRQQEK